MAAPTAKKLQFVVHDFVDGFDTYTEKPATRWAADVAFADVDPSAYAALVVPGGRAPEYIRNDEDCRRIVRDFAEAGEPIAALCHGPLVLAAAGVLDGRSTSAYPACAPDVRAAGAQWVGQRGPHRRRDRLRAARGRTTRPGCGRFLKVLRVAAPA